MTTDVIVPSNPADREAIKKNLKEISDVLTMIEAKRDYIKEVVEAMETKYELPKKFINKMYRSYHKQTFDKEVTEFSDFETLYEQIMQ